MAKSATANSPKPEPGPSHPTREGGESSGGEVRAGLLALAIAGLAEFGLVEPWASSGTRPILEEIPELVPTLLLGTHRRPEPTRDWHAKSGGAQRSTVLPVGTNSRGWRPSGCPRCHRAVALGERSDSSPDERESTAVVTSPVSAISGVDPRDHGLGPGRHDRWGEGRGEGVG